MNNGHCDQGCNSTECIWDGSDCLTPTSTTSSPSLTLTINTGCTTARTNINKLTLTLDTLTRAVTVVEGFEEKEGEACMVSVSFDNRYVIQRIEK